jgi:hypothetical protein
MLTKAFMELEKTSIPNEEAQLSLSETYVISRRIAATVLFLAMESHVGLKCPGGTSFGLEGCND